MECLSFHFIVNAFWNISFGASVYGIYQHCPPENLHSIKEGLAPYLLIRRIWRSILLMGIYWYEVE